MSNAGSTTRTTQTVYEKTRTYFLRWFDQQCFVDVDSLPKKILEQCYREGYVQATLELTPKSPESLKLAPFTNTVLTVYTERDQARAEVQELTGQLQKAAEINEKFHALLIAARDVEKACKGI